MTSIPDLQVKLDDLQKQFIDMYAKGGQVSIYMDAVNFLSGLQSSVEQIIRELTENSIDANADQVEVILTSNGQILIVDNGSGLNPFLSEDDIHILAAYFEILNKGDRRPGEDLDDLGSEGSQKSLGWMNYMVLKSQKRLRLQQNKKGVKGVGFQGARQISSNIEVLSRPSTKLAGQFYIDPQDIKNPPVCKMLLPTPEQFERAQIHPRFEYVEDAIQGLSGTSFASGTLIRLSKLNPGLLDRLSVDSLVHTLSSAHGDDIRGGVVVRVIDQFSPTGRRSIGGIVHIVPPPSYKGRLMIAKTFQLPSHKPFSVEIYISGEKETGDKIRLRRHGSDVSVLAETSLSELRKAPWTSRRLSGWVAFPETDDTTAPWNGAKTEPLDSPTRNQWLKILSRQLVPEIEEAIQRLDDELKKIVSTQGAKVVAEAFTEALAQIPELSSFHQGNQPGSGGGKGQGTKHGEVHEDRIYVKVVDQYNQGVGNVTLELLTKRNAALERYTTGTSGEHSFGIWDAGNYRIRALLPAGVKLQDELIDGNIFPFSLPTKAGKGIRIYLNTLVENAMPPSEGRGQKPKNYEVVFGPLPETELVYDSSLINFGKLIVNQGNPQVAEVYRKGNSVSIASLLSHCLVMAVGELGEERLPGYSVKERSQILSRLFTSTMTVLESRLK